MIVVDYKTVHLAEVFSKSWTKTCYNHILQNYPSKQKNNICIAFVQRRPNVSDVGPILHKLYTNVVCLLVWNGKIMISSGDYL